MKKKILLLCCLVGIAIFYLVRKERLVATPSAVGKSAPAEALANPAPEMVGTASAAPEESATNERTRPLPRPEDKKHPKPEVPVAVALPGMKGFVTSPYNGKIVDVNNIPSGTLVQDPTAPPESKSYFRVP
jgi:hypothetical protein